MQVWFEIPLPFLAGPLLVGGLTKVLTPPAQIPWPVRSGMLGLPLGPRLTGGAELAALMVIWLGSPRLAAGVATVSYAVLTGAGWWLRGRRCGCFGPTRLAVIGPVHIVLNTVGLCLSAALLGLSLIVPTQPRPALVQRGAAIAIAGGLIYLGLWLSSRLRAGKKKQAEPCRAVIGGVHLYVSADCPACRALEILIADLETDRRATVTVSRVEDQTSLPSTLAHLGVPCAVPLSPAGRQVCTPVSGLAAAMRHIQAITLDTRTGTDRKQLH